MEKSADVDLGTLKARIDIDTALVNQRVDEVLRDWERVQTGTGNLTTNMTREMVDGVTAYQQKLNIVTDKLTMQRQLIQQLQDTANKPATGQNTHAEIEKATVQLDRERVKLKELEAQFDRTCTAQQNFILSQDKVAKKAEEVKQTMDTREAGANAKIGMNLVSSGLRTIDQVAPGVAGNLGNIVTEINSTRAAMSIAGSMGAKWALGLSSAISIAVTFIMGALKSIQNAEEKRRKAFEEGVKNNKEYSESFRVLERNVSILNNEKSSVEELKEAKDALAASFPGLIMEWNKEGDAILANSDHLEKQTELLKAKQELARMEIAINEWGEFDNAKNMKKDIEGLENDLTLYNLQLKKANENGGIFSGLDGMYTSQGLTDSIAKTEEALRKV